MASAKNSNKAVYAGTFDPITNGHIDIIRHSLKVFDTLHVAVAGSTEKKTLFSVDDRVQMVRESVNEFGDRVIVDSFTGLLVEYVRGLDARVIVRGLRAVSDYEYEAQMAIINRRLASELETVFFVASNEYSFVSSSIVKNVAKHGGDIAQLVPTCVAKRFK